MKKILLFLSLALLTGCSEPNSLDRLKMDYACRDDGGTFSYNRLTYNITCKSGKNISLSVWNSTILPEEYYNKLK